MEKDKIVIYHGGCDDGFGGAYLFWKKFGDTAKYYSAAYREAPPDVKDLEVYIVDFSYPIEDMNKIQDSCKKLVWLDHHATSAKDAQTFKVKEGNTMIFDNKRSGTRLAWDYLSSLLTKDLQDPMIEVLRSTEDFANYIQDNDLWSFSLERSKEFSLALRSYKRKFEVWDGLVNLVEVLKRDGEAIRKFYDMKIDEICALAKEKDVLGFKGIPVVNCNGQFTSDVGNQLAVGKPFSMSWWYNHREKMFIFSLRSTDGGINVGELAKTAGGGGHPRAAGFKLKPEEVDSKLDLS